MVDSSGVAADELLVREYYAPVFLGTMFSTFLYGVNLNQFVSYLGYRGYDAWLTQSMVAILFTMVTIQECFSLYSIWFFSVQNFGNYEALSIQCWATTASLGVVIISIVVQQYFTWRVKIFSQSWILFGMLSLCSVSASVMDFVNTCASLAASDPVSLDAELAMVQATLAINVFVNVVDALLLLYYLLRHRTGFKRTDTVIRRLVVTCVESPLLNAFLSLVDMIVFKATFPTNWSLIAAIPLGQVYTLSILAMLNSRASLRDAWNGVTDIDVDQLQDRHGRLNRRITLSKQSEPVRVGVTVESHARVEVDPFAARVKDGRKKRTKAGSASAGTTSVESVVKSGRNEHEMEEFSIAVHALNPRDDASTGDEKIAIVA
ncbi:uncharacterized protein C8Q71DRAFT_893313 [Rhodofomes roseus]|uniref:DUF6534 domain-containing protein n=1 Tax=Rhodofomes roseus TaxID=34475 RepID=A0ABQ8KQI0_9APHY|nr:uncharacterized protein C8Q71DRAFT_893313 [Rhodofomes roseus]KAH9840186.1 hypothetical protein C8Q71DRAFT_893313 [Rhodofomes roseus]